MGLWSGKTSGFRTPGSGGNNNAAGSPVMPPQDGEGILKKFYRRTQKLLSTTALCALAVGGVYELDKAVEQYHNVYGGNAATGKAILDVSGIVLVNTFNDGVWLAERGMELPTRAKHAFRGTEFHRAEDFIRVCMPRGAGIDPQLASDIGRHARMQEGMNTDYVVFGLRPSERFNGVSFETDRRNNMGAQSDCNRFPGRQYGQYDTYFADKRSGKITAYEP